MADLELSFTPVAELAARIRNKELSPVEVMENCLARIDEVNPALDCFFFVFADAAMAQTRKAEAAPLRADVGIVWTTEVVEAKKHGRKIDGVAIPAPLNKADKVGYAIGALSTGRNAANARAYLDYLTTDAAQKIYAGYGFVPASAEELKLRPIPR